MKRSLLLCLCAVAISATATQSFNIRKVPQNHTPIKAGMWEISDLSHRFATRQAPKKATTETPISSAPAGQLFENMYVNSNSYGLGFGDVYAQVVDGGLGGVVEGNDGYIYVQAPISQAYVWGLGSPWLKCTKAGGDTIVMATPQIYAIDAGDPYYARRMKLTADSSSFEVDNTNTTVKFVWKDHVLTQVDDCLIGLCDATGDWFYMGDYDIKYTINPDKVAQVPAGAIKTTYKLEYIPKAANLDSTTSTMTSVHIAPSDPYHPYITDIFSDLADGAVRAEFSADGKGILPTRQYMGIDKMYNSHVYLLTGNAKVVTPDKGSKYFNYDQCDSVAFTISGANGDTLQAAYPSSIIVNAGRSNLYIIKEFVAPKLTAEEDKAIVPADPTLKVTQLSKCDQLNIVIPTVGTGGEQLNENYLYYNIYYNDSIYTFTPDQYEGLEAAMTDIPYPFCDTNYDFYTSNGKTTVYFYDKNWSKIGVQSIYRGGGEENRSKVVYAYKETSVEALSGTKAVKSTECFDLTGRKVTEQTSGLCVKRITYTDGSVKVIKEFKR